MERRFTNLNILHRKVMLQTSEEEKKIFIQIKMLLMRNSLIIKYYKNKIKYIV
jgi:hypothetical protein